MFLKFLRRLGAIKKVTLIKIGLLIMLKNMLFFFVLWYLSSRNSISMSSVSPVVVNTWTFAVGNEKAWDVIYNQKRSALDAIEEGCTECEKYQVDHTVGFGGSPDENGETTLDAMIMDGPTHDVGAVAALRRIKNAIGVARKVLEHTKHSMLVGSQASDFAISMGFKEESLSTNYSTKLWEKWRAGKCQPNFWKNVSPNPAESCGPYKPIKEKNVGLNSVFGAMNHDTVGMIAIDMQGRMAVGTSSNGAIHKIPGRVGDSPIVGAGAYVDQDVGGAAATGDGDIMMRTLPSYQIVENMRRGMSPEEAARDAMKRIVAKFPDFSGGLVSLSKTGEYGAACHGLESFPYMVRNVKLGNSTVFNVKCL